MLDYKNHRYSRESFPEYKFRAVAEFVITEVKDHEVVTKKIRVDIYTTNPLQDEVSEVLFDHSAEKVTGVDIIHWATKEQDDAASALIDEWLKETEDERN